MISSKTSTILRQLYGRTAWNCRNFASLSAAHETDKDPAPFFFDSEVQKALRTLSRVDYKKVFRARKEGKRLDTPEYKFCTDEELKRTLDDIAVKAEHRLHMPPVVKPRPEETKVLSRDPAISGYSKSKYAFTDISFGISNKNRLIVVRDVDGTLRYATCNERSRLNQIYFPISGRELMKPRMFEEKYLESLLERGEYEFILDRACIQFEPDDPEYQQITQQIYNYVNSVKKFDALRSTRHFGPLVFHLVWKCDIDNLLTDILGSGSLDEAMLLVVLYDRINPNVGIIREKHSAKDPVTIIKRYAEIESLKRNQIEKALASRLELDSEKKKVEEGIKRAHGIDTPSEEPQT